MDLLSNEDSGDILDTTVVLLRHGMRKLLKIMVGDRGLEPLTPPVCEVEEKPNIKKKMKIRCRSA
jgi:hypothetical protein